MRFGLICLLLTLSQNVFTQEFTAIDSRIRVQGIVDLGSELLFYGSGLTWTDLEGKITRQEPLIKGLPSSRILSAASSEGVIWIVTPRGFYALDDLGLSPVVEDKEGKLSMQYAYSDAQGFVWLLTRSGIYKCDKNYNAVKVFEGEELAYAKKMIIDGQGRICFFDYNHVYVIESNGTVRKHTPHRKPSFQDLGILEDGSLAVLEYRNMYYMENDSLMLQLNGNDLVSGLKFFEGIWKASDDFWLLSTGGNVFRNNKGKWTNFVPPSGYKTGNLRESFIQTSRGDLWIGVSDYPLLHMSNFGSWKQIELQGKSKKSSLTRTFNVANEIYAQDSKSNELFKWENGEMVNAGDVKEERIYALGSLNGALHYASDFGIGEINVSKKKVNGKVTALGVVGNEILYGKDNKLFSYINGTSTELKDNIHFLGWEEIKNPRIYTSHDGSLWICSNNRYGQISVYNGNEWRKIIDIDSKKLGNVTKVLSNNSCTYLITEKNGIAQYKDGVLSWLIKNEEGTKVSRAHMANDGSLWIVFRNGKFCFINNDLIQYFDTPVEKANYSFHGVYYNAEGLYTLYIGEAVLQCDFN